MGSVIATGNKPIDMQSNHSNRESESLNRQNDALMRKIDALEKKLEIMERKQRDEEEKKQITAQLVNNDISIDKFVDEWFESNKEVDIGVIDLPIVGEIDIFPDRLEKHIYKKSLKIASTLLFEMLQNVNVKVLDKTISVKIE